MMQAFTQYLHAIAHNHFVIMVALCIVLDTFLGCLRAIMEHKFNSAFGINGAIRKTAMIVSVLFLMLADALVGLNVIAFINQDIRDVLRITKIGLGEFFSLMYILYEAMSIIKNWILIGLPMNPKAKEWIEKSLGEMTQEVGKGDGHDGA